MVSSGDAKVGFGVIPNGEFPTLEDFVGLGVGFYFKGNELPDVPAFVRVFDCVFSKFIHDDH